MNIKPEQIPGEAVSAAMTAYATSCDRGVYEDAIRHAIAAALPVLLGEPVAWIYEERYGYNDSAWIERINRSMPCWETRNQIPLYTLPTQDTTNEHV